MYTSFMTTNPLPHENANEHTAATSSDQTDTYNVNAHVIFTTPNNIGRCFDDSKITRFTLN